MRRLLVLLLISLIVFTAPAQTVTQHELPLNKFSPYQGKEIYLHGKNGVMASFQYLNMDKNTEIIPEVKFANKPIPVAPEKGEAPQNAKNAHHLTLRFDIAASNIIMTSENNTYYGRRDFNWSESHKVAEIDAEEGLFDIMIDAYDNDYDDQLYVFLHNLSLSSDVDTTINLRDMATHYLYFHGMDEKGIPLLSNDTTLLMNRKLIVFEYPARFIFQAASFFLGGEQKDYVRLSDISSDFLITLGQGNVRQGKMYVIDLGYLNGISEDVTLESNPDDYKHMSMVFQKPPSAEEENYLIFQTGTISRSRDDSNFLMYSYYEVWNTKYIYNSLDTLTIYLSNVFHTETLRNFVGAVSFWENIPDYDSPEKTIVTSPFYLMPDSDSVQFCNFYPPVKADYKVLNNSVVNFGNSAPFANIYSVNSESSIFNYTSLYGQCNEARNLDNYASFYTIMQGTDILRTDTLSNFEEPYTVTASGPYSFSVTDSNFYVNGIRGIMEVLTNFDLSNEDSNPPTLTSFKILDSNGLIQSQFTTNDQAIVHFSAADYSDEGFNDLSTVSLYYKKHDDETWNNLDIQEMPGYYDPVFNHGQYFIGNLTPVIQASTAAFYDLKIEVTDNAGNLFQESLSPAFEVLNNATIEEPVQPYQLSLHAYPNPVTDVLAIEYSGRGPCSINILDAQGNLVYKSITNENEQHINLKSLNLANGIYFIQMTSNSKTIAKKIIYKN